MGLEAGLSVLRFTGAARRATTVTTSVVIVPHCEIISFCAGSNASFRCLNTWLLSGCGCPACALAGEQVWVSVLHGCIRARCAACMEGLKQR